MWIQNLSIAVEETDENNTVEVCICVRYLEVGLDPQVTVAFSTIPGTAGRVNIAHVYLLSYCLKFDGKEYLYSCENVYFLVRVPQ